MIQTFSSLFLSLTSSSWTLLSSQEPLDPGAGILAWCAFGVCRVIYMVWQWIYLCCPVRTACSYFICRHQMDSIRVYTQLHTVLRTLSVKLLRWKLRSRTSSVVGMPLKALLSAEVWKLDCCIGEVISWVWALCFTWCEVGVWKWPSCLLKKSNGVICTLGSCYNKQLASLIYTQVTSINYPVPLT